MCAKGDVFGGLFPCPWTRVFCSAPILNFLNELLIAQRALYPLYSAARTQATGRVGGRGHERAAVAFDPCPPLPLARWAVQPATCRPAVSPAGVGGARSAKHQRRTAARDLCARPSIYPARRGRHSYARPPRAWVTCSPARGYAIPPGAHLPWPMAIVSGPVCFFGATELPN